MQPTSTYTKRMSKRSPHSVRGRYILDLDNPIAQGTSTKVVKATRPGSYEIFAVKIIDLKNKTAEFISRARQEAHLHQILSGHRNIIRTFDVFEENMVLHIVMEYISCDLLTYLSDRHGGLSEAESRHIFKQLRKVISYLHRKNIVHGDIKLENVLFETLSCRIVLIDFGSASILQKKDEALTILSGTQQYVAPEVVLGEHYDGRKSDIYSLGVVLFCITTNRLPFDDEDGIYYYSWVENFHEALGSGDVSRMLPPVPLTTPLVDLLQKMLCLDPKHRITMKKIKSDAWHKNKEVSPMFASRLRDKRCSRSFRNNKSNRVSQWFANSPLALFT
eukprot:TRINITY_DN19016_c0_g1_i1.p1 TRINITY_DN19016_c0_g1~~TRINITY_DN19016_c0_g1_i1.p1  ORF type:complete len:333 (-),score=27.93 TRINITY_DN19016_c0_g1_i1:140-1138(-)